MWNESLTTKFYTQSHRILEVQIKARGCVRQPVTGVPDEGSPIASCYFFRTTIALLASSGEWSDWGVFLFWLANEKRSFQRPALNWREGEYMFGTLNKWLFQQSCQFFLVIGHVRRHFASERWCQIRMQYLLLSLGSITSLNIMNANITKYPL